MIILKKLLFLYYSNASKYIYLNFILTKFKNIFLKKKNKAKKKSTYKFFGKKKNYTRLFFKSCI